MTTPSTSGLSLRVRRPAPQGYVLQAGDQAFTFVGSAAFSGAPGELRYSAGVVSVDVDGDRQSDMEIGLLGAPRLTATDLIR